MINEDDLIHAAWVEISGQLKKEVDETKKFKSEMLQNYPAVYDLVSGEYAAVNAEGK